MIRKFLPIVLFVFVIASSSCGTAEDDAADGASGGGSGSLAGSCDQGGLCSEYSGTIFTEAEADCASDGGTWSTSACSQSNAVAKCLWNTGSGNTYTAYFDATWAAVFESLCVDDENSTATWSTL